MNRKVCLGDLIRVKHGFAFSGEYFKDQPQRDVLVTPGNFNIGGGFNSSKLKYYDGPDIPGFVLQPGNLIVTMTDLSKNADTLGFPAVVPSSNAGYRYLHNQRIGRVELTSDAVDKKYLYYLMCSREYRSEILASATGTTVKHTAPARIEAFSFNLPSLTEQRRIATILGSLDDKIDLNHELSANLEAMTRALFKSWFVDFDPVRTRHEGRGISALQEISRLFPDSFRRSELGRIPTGWTLKAVSEIAFASRSMLTPRAFPEELFDHYSIPAFDAARIPNPENGRSIKSNKFCLPPTAVLLSRLNPDVPRIWIGDSSRSRRAVCSTEFAVMAPKGVSKEWLYGLFSSDSFCERFASMVTGTSRSHQRVTLESLLAMQTLFPGKPLERAFTKVAAALLSRSVHCRTESATLTRTRDALLPKLISGQPRIGEAEPVLERSA